ncbi:MAG: hypothetical protein PHX25_00065 [Candidatus Pacebacteria bacterium]|nr:hypothetical protein [Candidatus Paceibacterota bacterium]
MEQWTLEKICREMEQNHNTGSPLYKLIVQSNHGKIKTDVLLEKQTRVGSIGDVTRSILPDFLNGNFGLSTINHIFRRHGAVSLGLGLGSSWLCYNPSRFPSDLVCRTPLGGGLITPELSETTPYWFKIEKTELFKNSGFETFYQVYEDLKQSDLLHKCPSYADGGDLREQIELVRSRFGNQNKILLWRSVFLEKFQIKYTEAHISLTVPYLDCTENEIGKKRIKISKGGRWNDLTKLGDDAEEKNLEENFITVICK